MKHFDRLPTLSQLIRKEISRRVIFSLLLIVLFGLLLSAYNVSRYLSDLKTQAQIKAKPIANFIISQVLVSNPEAIHTEIAEFNSANQSMQATWKSNDKKSGKNPIIYFQFPYFWKYRYPINEIGNQHFGTLFLKGSLFYNAHLVNLVIEHFLLILLFGVLFLFILFPLSQNIPKKLFLSPLEDILLLLTNKASKQKKLLSSQTQETQHIKERIIALIQTSQEQARKATIGSISMQVAHDIKSPLIALESAIRHLPAVDEDKRRLIQSSTQQIKEIANNLLHKHTYDSSPQKKKPELHLLLPIIHHAIAQKSVEFSTINLTLKCPHLLASCFLYFVPVELKRMLSNLLNNAIEATPDKQTPHISLNISNEPKHIKLAIQDSGKGVKAKHIELITREGVTFKTDGSGLGLFHAKQTMEAWGGELHILSKENKGTTVSLRFPKRPNPYWFVIELSLNKHTTAVIVDDSEAIFQLWEEKLNKINIPTLYFPSAEACIDWHQQVKKDKHYVLLIDYEFTNNNLHGIELIETLQSCYPTLLVSSQEEKIVLYNHHTDMPIPFLPKYILTELPVYITEAEPTLIVLVNNTSLSQSIKKRAEKHRIPIQVYQSKQGLLAKLLLCSRSIPVYLDQSYQDIEAIIMKLGFSQPYLLTHEEIPSATSRWVNKDVFLQKVLLNQIDKS